MRTVTFSNADVAKVVNEAFVCVSINRRPGFLNTDPTTERGIRDDTYEAFATKNFATFLATPDRKVLSYLSGYFSPAWFLQEVSFATSLATATCGAGKAWREDKLPDYVRLQGERRKALNEVIRKLEEEEKTLRSGPGGPGTRNQESRKRGLLEGLRHLVAVHADLAERSAEVQAPVPLEDVFRKYLYGNSFTEE